MVSAGWGPVTRQPSARSAAMAGMDQLDLLAAEHAAFAGVGIEAGDRQAGLGNAEVALQAAQRARAARFDQRRRQALRQPRQAGHAW